MIRINLLPQKESRKKRSGRQMILLFAMAIVVEIGALYLWQSSLETDLNGLKQQRNSLQQEIGKFERQIKAQKGLQGRQAILKKRYQVLKAVERPGPENLLLFLSYVLRPPSQISRQVRDIKKNLGSEEGDLNHIGWKCEWDPSHIFIKSLREASGEMMIEGVAKDLSDVAEFINRLNDTAFFTEVLLQSQRFRNDSRLKLRYIEFRLKCRVDYDGALYADMKKKG
ncbi:MAG: PilN domain-containing protein [Myxococcales bacterium]|nr:PilN domain-containing protein [Myxococcales bacterium]